MPLPLPNLDDRTFADLSTELRSLIPRYDKAWTNHNPSDPGITLIELFAWLAEMILYRMNRVEKQNYLNFLELIGVQPVGGTDEESLDDMLARGLKSLQERTRAVSDEDFEALALQALPDKIARATAVADRNLEETTTDDEGHVSVIILPKIQYLGLPEQPALYDTQLKQFVLNRTSAVVKNALNDTSVKELYREIHQYLDERRLITTIVHVVGPPLTAVSLEVTLQAKSGVNTENLTKDVGESLARFLDPYEGWLDSKGWPNGRDLYRSELYQLIEAIEGVDHATGLDMKDANGDKKDSLIAVADYSLVCLDALTVTVSAEGENL